MKELQWKLVKKIGIDNEFIFSNCLPERKTKIVNELQLKGEKVIMGTRDPKEKGKYESLFKALTEKSCR